MDSPFKFPASPGTPLFPLSPERVNGTRGPYNGHAQSPSVPEFGKPSMGVDPFTISIKSPKSASRHSRNNSDALVLGMVARFDSMSIKDYKASTEMLIKRAEMSKEIAESESRKLKEELASKDDDIKKRREDGRHLKKDIEDFRDREQKLVKRLEVLTEELHRKKETHGGTVAVYEKEIRRARKEAFKSSSTLVKTQEELKSTRNTLKITRANLESEKAKASKREQDAFTAQYQLVGVQEELEKARERMKILEEERDSLKTSLKEEEVARIALEGRIALPTTGEDDDDDLLASPVKSPRKKPVLNSDSEDKENVVPQKAVQLKSLHEELTVERRLRQRAQDQVEFMKMECQFQCCSCRIAEQKGHNYVHDDKFSAEMERIKTSVPLPDHSMSLDLIESSVIKGVPTSAPLKFSPSSGSFRNLIDPGVLVDDSKPRTGDFAMDTKDEAMEDMIRDDASMKEEDVEMSHTLMGDEPEAIATADEEEEEDEDTEASKPLEEPQTPIRPQIRTITTTTTVPIAFSPYPTKPRERDPLLPNTPMTVGHVPRTQVEASPFQSRAFKADGTLDREAALELIRQRRGRARSVAIGQATPRKQMIEGNVRRDISAPALKTWAKH